jgi:hypothetical protein
MYLSPLVGVSRLLRHVSLGVAPVAFLLALGSMTAASAALPPAGNPDGSSPVPPEAMAEDTSIPDRVIGNGTAASCTSQAVVDAVALGGVITFDCGPGDVTIDMYATAKVFNDASNRVVLDGGGTITLNGRNAHRILYMNTCDPVQNWTTSHCQNQDHPELTVQNLTFVNGNSKNEHEYDGGGAIWVRGGRFKVLNSRFFSNVCADIGPDVGGGAVRVFSQYNTLPVYVVNSTFGGAPGLGNVCSNAGALSSIGVSWTIINSLFTDNDTTGWGANPAKPGTPGGGNGGAIALDGNTYTLRVLGSRFEWNHARAGGGAIFYVSNNRTGEMYIHDSYLVANPSDDFETQGYPGFFIIARAGFPVVTNSYISQIPPQTYTGVPGGDSFGLVDPTTGLWTLTDVEGDTGSFYFGNPGDYPFLGDWNCDGVSTPGLYRQSDGYVYLRNTNAQGNATISFFFGNPGDVPLAGDFDGDGCDSVGLYRPSQGRFFVINELGSADKGLGAATTDYVFGNPGDIPFAGDFNGNGIDTFGLYRTSTGLVYQRDTHTTGNASRSFIYGDPGDRFMTGDWTADGTSTPGVFRPAAQTVYLRHQNSAGNADAVVGTPSTVLLPVAGFVGDMP